MDAASHRYSMEVVHFDPVGVEFYCTCFCKCSSLQGLRYQYQWWACQVLLHWAGYFVDVADFHCWGSTAGYCLQWSICLFFCLVWNHIYCLHNAQRFFFWCLFQRSKGAGRLGQQQRIRRSLHKEEAFKPRVQRWVVMSATPAKFLYQQEAMLRQGQMWVMLAATLNDELHQ